MAYYFYMGKMLCPVPPSKLQLKVNNKNKTMTLINEGEVNILKHAGLTEISFELRLPNVKYPYATYKSGFQNAKYFLDELEKMKIGKEPFQFIVTRTFPDGRMLFDTNMKVSLEEYDIKEDQKDGFDVTVSVKLKQYKGFGTKTCNITFADTKPKVSPPVETRPAESAGGKIEIGSNVIVNGRLHRDSYGKGPGQTRTNYAGKVNFINKKGSHPYHVTDPSGSWLGWVTESSVKRA